MLQVTDNCTDIAEVAYLGFANCVCVNTAQVMLGTSKLSTTDARRSKFENRETVGIKISRFMSKVTTLILSVMPGTSKLNITETADGVMSAKANATENTDVMWNVRAK
jgi:hypothetical protein